MDVELCGKKITENYLFKKKELQEFLGLEGKESEYIYNEVPKLWLGKRTARVRLGTLVDWMYENNYECLLERLGLLGLSNRFCSKKDMAIQECIDGGFCFCSEQILKQCVYNRGFCDSKEKIVKMCAQCEKETLEFANDPLVARFSPRLLNSYWRRVEEKPTSSVNGFVYFISDGEYVKIGSTNNNVLTRLKELQCGNPRELHVLFTIPIGHFGSCDYQLAAQAEHFLHLIFKRYRKCGEWFDILDVIDVAEWKKYYGSICKPGATSTKEYKEIVKRRTYK